LDEFIATLALNQTRQQTCHASEGSPGFSASSRASRVLSLAFGFFGGVGYHMDEVYAEVACHIPQEGMYVVRLHGGPWDGKEVGVRNPDPPFVRVNGPRHGQHSIWVTHLYERRGDRY